MEKRIQPAEWAPHDAVWVAWPSDANLWQQDIEPAQEEFTNLCRAIVDDGGEKLEVLVPDSQSEAQARSALTGLNARFHRIPFGDIWLRDTAPIFTLDNNTVQAMSFPFNGWGKKFRLLHDPDVSEAISKAGGFEMKRFTFVLEGGSIEVDGIGTCLTTKQCLLNPNRNPSWSKEQLEAGLKDSLGIEKVLWLDEGLVNDHTDGHIDTLARFVSPGVVVCMESTKSDDPNGEMLDRIYSDLCTFTDVRGEKLRVVRVPSPGKLVDEEGDIMPASYVNFYIANRAVIVPTYGLPNDAKAVEAIGKLFPDRKTIGLPAKAILTGGGAFHCITQQQPRGGAR